MIKIKAACIALALMSAQPLSALLPPLYESLNEYRALLNDQKLSQLFTSGEPIVSVVKNETGFVVTTTRHHVVVEVVYEKQNMPGPAKFHFVYGTPLENQ